MSRLGLSLLFSLCLGGLEGLASEDKKGEVLRTGQDVMVQNEERRRIHDVYAEAVLTIGGGDRAERVKKFYWWKKLTEDNVHYFTLTRFYFPPEVKGEAILFFEREGNENEVLMYLPAYKKIRRVESQLQSSGFMGSEFSYSDIATPHVSEYQYKLLKSESCPRGESGEENQGMQCYQIEALPVSESVKERIGYSKIVNWVRHDHFMVVQGEYYSLDGQLKKRIYSSQFKQVDGEGKGKWIAQKVRVESLKTGRFTALQLSQLKINEGILDSIFTQQNLGRP